MSHLTRTVKSNRVGSVPQPRVSKLTWVTAVLKSLDKVIDGTPRVDTYEVSNATFHKIAARN